MKENPFWSRFEGIFLNCCNIFGGCVGLCLVLQIFGIQSVFLSQTYGHNKKRFLYLLPFLNGPPCDIFKVVGSKYPSAGCNDS